MKNGCQRTYRQRMKEAQDKTDAEMDGMPVCDCCGGQVYPYATAHDEEGTLPLTLIEYTLLRMPDGDSYFGFLNRKGDYFVTFCPECDNYSDSEVSIEDAIKQWREGHRHVYKPMPRTDREVQ